MDSSVNTISCADPEAPQRSPTTTSNRVQYWACLSCAGGGFAYGTVLGWATPAASLWYDTSPTAANCSLVPLVMIRAFLSPHAFYLDPGQFSWVVSVFALAAALTAVPSGLMLQHLGRKTTAFIFLLPTALGWLLSMFATTFQALFIGRLLLGVGCGTSSVVVPIYNAEVSVPEIRGRTGALYQLMVNTGLLFMFSLGPLLSLPSLVFASSIAALPFYVAFYFAPETPTFLVSPVAPSPIPLIPSDRLQMSRGLEQEAEQALRRLRGAQSDTRPEMVRLRKQQDEGQSSTCAALMRPNTLRGLAICGGLMVFVQMSGINALLYFKATIFRKVDSTLTDAQETAITALVQLLGSLFTCCVVDRAGRRVLLLASAVACAFATLIIGVYFEANARDPGGQSGGWLPLVSMCVFFLVFSMGLGTISWILLGEVFDADVKGLASSMAVALNFALSFAVTKGAFRISMSLGVGGLFWMFSGFSVAGIVFIILVVPETKRKSFQEIQNMLTLYNYA